MEITPKIQKAINLASKLHKGQMRKGDPYLPFIVHPYSVAWILTNYTDDEDIIVAGLLHDVLEDVKGYKFDNLKNDFGEKVAKIVKEVSEDKDPDIQENSKDTWETRKRKYLNNLENGSFEAMMVSTADKIHNLQSMKEAYKEQGNNLWNKFNSPVDKKLWFYEEVAKILNKKLDNKITKKLNQELEMMKNAITVVLL